MTTSEMSDAFEKLRCVSQAISDLQVENSQLKQELEFFRREWARMKTPVHEREPQQPQWKDANGQCETRSPITRWLCRDENGEWSIGIFDSRPKYGISRLD